MCDRRFSVESWTSWVLCYEALDLIKPSVWLASSYLGRVVERAVLPHYCRVGGEVRFPTGSSLTEQRGSSLMLGTVGGSGSTHRHLLG